MVAVNWRKIPTVLQPDELMDKAFSAATKKANLVDDPDKYHRVRKQMLAMIHHIAHTHQLQNAVTIWGQGARGVACDG